MCLAGKSFRRGDEMPAPSAPLRRWTGLPSPLPSNACQDQKTLAECDSWGMCLPDELPIFVILLAKGGWAVHPARKKNASVHRYRTSSGALTRQMCQMCQMSHKAQHARWRRNRSASCPLVSTLLTSGDPCLAKYDGAKPAVQEWNSGRWVPTPVTCL